MNSKDFKDIFSGKQHLKRDSIILKGYNNQNIVPIGYFMTKVKINDLQKNIKFYVVDNGGPIVGGRDFMTIFGIGLDYINTISTETKSSVKKVINKYKDTVFGNKLGCYKYAKISLQLKPEARPVFRKPRNVPFAYEAEMNKELQRLVDEEILAPVDSSNWGTPLVAVLKADGKIRICGDYKATVNPYIEEVVYPLPTIDSIFAKLHKGKQFTKIDLSQAYNQFELDDETSKLLVVSTKKGLFKPKRMPFGTSPASAKCQKYVEQLFQGMENVINFSDDIIVTGESKEEHLRTLEAVLENLEKAGLTARLDKCQFFKDEIEYLGHKISKNGLQKVDSKVRAISLAPAPRNLTELRAFLGMVSYYSRFIYNLATHLQPLYALLRKDVKFCWSQGQNEAFEKVKRLIAEDITLMHFNPKLPLILQTDASNAGVAAVLIHRMTDGSERPIACVSRTLMPAERNYSTILKESVAIFYGVQKFEQYLIGNRFTLRTDHKPLTTIFGEHKQIPTTYANRLQRIALYLSGFNYKAEYVKGKDNQLADYLSRAPLRIKTIDQEYEGKGNFINFISNSVEWPIDNELIRAETSRDAVLKKVKKYIMHDKWPSRVDDTLKQYFLKRHELSVDQDIILWGHRVVVPRNLQERVLEELHEPAHLGITKIKSVARGYLWFPGIDRRLEEIVKSCTACLKHRSNPPKAEYTPWQPEKEPWYRIHADYLELNHMYFLIIIDSYSKYPEIFPCKSLKSEETEEKFRECFARFGLPKIVVTDNGTNFVAGNMTTFFKINGIKHITTPVNSPQSNGQAENMVKTFKHKVKTTISDAKNKTERVTTIVARFLLNYRIAEHASTSKSPAEIMFGRKLRTRFDLLRNPSDNPPTEITEKLRESQENQAKYYGNGKRREFSVGERIMVKDLRTPHKPTWSKGVIEKKIGRTTYLANVEGQMWKRHANQLHKMETKQPEHRDLSKHTAPNDKTQRVSKVTYSPRNNPESTSATHPTSTFNLPDQPAHPSSSVVCVSSNFVKDRDLSVNDEQIDDNCETTNDPRTKQKTKCPHVTNLNNLLNRHDPQSDEPVEPFHKDSMIRSAQPDSHKHTEPSSSGRRSNRIRKPPRKLQDYVTVEEDKVD